LTPRKAIDRPAKAAKKAAKRNRRTDPTQARFAVSDISAAEALADIKAGADMAATMAAAYSIGLLAFGIELPIGIARSWQAMSGGGALG